MSFYTSLSGLKAAQTDLSVISNNVANVGSIGFKKSRADFGDLVSSSAFQSGNTTGSGTRVDEISQEFSQGGFQSSDRALDLAISGQGFFVTKTANSLSFTRNGSFSVDSNRYLVDSTGADVQVLPVDTNGTVTASGISSSQNLQVPLTSGQPKATSAIDLSATFPSDADIPADRSTYTSSNPYAFNRYDSNSYNYSSAITVYDASGNAQQATVYYTRETAPSSSSTSSKWQARLFIGDKQASADGNVATTPPAALELTFAADGSLTSPTSGTAFSSVTPTGAASALAITMDYGSATRQATSTFSPGAVTQNGKPVGQLSNVSVGTDGLVTATFSDGSSQNLGKIMIANFANPNGLTQLGNSRWGATGLSGEPIVAQAGTGSAGSIQSGALEEANVDITEELVSLISAQRNFSANAKAIETSNNMTDTIVNLRT